MAKLIDNTGADTGVTYTLEQLKESVQNCRTSLGNVSPPFKTAKLNDAVVDAIRASGDYESVQIDLAKESPDSTDYHLLVTGVDIEKRFNLSPDAKVHKIQCPSAACP